MTIKFYKIINIYFFKFERYPNRLLMSEKDLALSQSSQKRFSRTSTSKVVVHKQTVVTTTSAQKTRTKSESQSQVVEKINFQGGNKVVKNPPETTRQVAIYHSHSTTPKQSVIVSAKKKQQKLSVKFQQDFKDLMALSQEMRQALKKVQRFDRFVYPKLSEKQLGQTLKNQIARLEKIKNSKKQMRSKFYDNQLLTTALYNHVKLVNQLSKQNDELLVWKKQKERQSQSLKKGAKTFNQKLQQQKIKQQQAIQNLLVAKDYVNAKNSIAGFLKKFEKQSSISKVQLTLMNHMKILIQQKQSSLKFSIPQMQKSESGKQSLKKSQVLPPEKNKLQKQQLKDLEAIDAQLSSKNYSIARNLINNYTKKFENEPQLSTQSQIAAFSYIIIIIDEFQAFKKQSGSKNQISKLRTELQKQRKKISQLEKHECKRMQDKKQKDVKKQRDLIQGALDSKQYISAKNSIVSYLKKYQKQQNMNVEISLLSSIKILVQENEKQQSLERTRSKSANQQKISTENTNEKEKDRIKNENQKLKVEIQNQRIKYQEIMKKNQENQRIVRELKSSTSEREFTKLKTEKQRLEETLQKQKTKAEQNLKRAQTQKVTILELERKNKQLSESRSRPETPGKTTNHSGRTKTQDAYSTEKEMYSKDRVKQLTKQLTDIKKEEAKSKLEISRLQNLVATLQAQLGSQQKNLVFSKNETVKPMQKEQNSKSLGKNSASKQKKLTKAEIMSRQREIQRQKVLIEGHLRDRHYYYAKPMLISFLRNFQAVEGYEQLIKYFEYFLGIIDDLELARRQVSQNKGSTPAKTPPKAPKTQQKSQQMVIIEKELRQIKTTLIHKQQIYTQVNTTITMIVQLIQGSGEEWWKKLPRRNHRASELLTALYKIIDKFRQSQTAKTQQIAELERKLASTTENSQEINTVLTILKTVQSIIKKKQFMGIDKDPWVQLFKGINTRKQIFSLLNRVFQSFVNQSKNKLILQRKNFENSIKNYEKQISTLSIKIQELQNRLKKAQNENQSRTPARKSRQDAKSEQRKSVTGSSREKDNKQDQNYKLLQQYIQEEKKMLKQLQKIQNQKQNINQKLKGLEIKYKQASKDLVQANKRVRQLEQSNTKLNSQINSFTVNKQLAEEEKRTLRISIQKQYKDRYESQIQKLQSKWNSERTKFERQIQLKQGIITSKQKQFSTLIITKQTQIRSQFQSQIIALQKEIQLKQNVIAGKQKQVTNLVSSRQSQIRQQFQSRIISLQRDIQTKDTILVVKEKQLESKINMRQNKLRQQFQIEKNRLQRQFSTKETHIRETIVKQFRIKQQALIQQFSQKQKSNLNVRSEDNGLQIVQLNNKLIRLQQQLNKYITITETKQQEINSLKAEMERIIQQEVQKALKAQQQDFNRFLDKNDKQREEFFENVVLPQKKQQWRIQYNQVVENVSIISKPVEQITINMQQQRESINNEWKQRIVLMQTEFQNRMSNIIQEKDKKWTSQIQAILVQKQTQWNNRFITQINQEKQKIMLERSSFSQIQIDRLIVQKQNQWNQRISHILQQQRIKVIRQKEEQFSRIQEQLMREIKSKQQQHNRLLLQKENHWSQLLTVKQKQWQINLIKRQHEIRTQVQNNIVVTPQQREELVLLKQIIQNQKIQLRQMQILVERVQQNRHVVSYGGQQSELKYRQLQLQQTKNMFEVKSMYEIRVSSLEKDILILQDKLSQAQITINNYKSMSPNHKQSKNIMFDLQKQIIMLQATMQSKDNQISYLKKTIDNLEVQTRQQRNSISELRLKGMSNSNLQNNQKFIDQQYEIRLLKEREHNLIKQIQSNQSVNAQLRRSYQRKISELHLQNEQQHRQFIKISRVNERLKSEISNLEQQVRKPSNKQSSIEAMKLKQILRSIQIEKQKKVYIYGDSDQTQMQILKRINGQVSELVQTNRHLQMKLLLLEKEAQLSSNSPDTINFFLMLQHRLQSLVNFLLDNQYIESSEAYNEYLQKSRKYLKQIRLQQYFNEFSKLMKQLFHQVYDLNSQEIEEKAKELSQLKEQMQDILDKQIQINQENQFGKNDHYHGYHNSHELNVKTINDARYLMKEYLRRRDQECLGVVCRTLGLQF